MSDPDLSDSFFEELGFDKEKCTTCHAHLYHGFCLNACDLPPDTRARFLALLAHKAKKKRKDDEAH